MDLTHAIVVLFVVGLSGIGISVCAADDVGTSVCDTSYNPTGYVSGVLHVGFLFLGQPNDLGWNLQHDKGRLFLQYSLPDEVQTHYVDNVITHNQSIAAIYKLMKEENCKLIIATSFGQGDAALALAECYPQIYFVHISGYAKSSHGNFATAMSKIEEPTYLSGLLAGVMRSSGSLCFIYSFPETEDIRGLNSFVLGVQKYAKDAQIAALWINSYGNPEVELMAAWKFVAMGCSLLAQSTDSITAQEAFHDVSLFSIGFNSDMTTFIGNTVLTSPMFLWGSTYYNFALSVLNHSWIPNLDLWEGISEGMCDLSATSQLVPTIFSALLEAAKDNIVNGENPFVGPIYDIDGILRIPEGSYLSDEELKEMDWYVAGILDLGQFSLDSCTEGLFFNVSANTCMSCPLGQQPSITYFCEPCPIGTFSVEAGVICAPCPSGCVKDWPGPGECQKCAAGSAPSTNATSCILCSPGTYAPFNGTSFCDICEKGTYAEEEGATSCTKCPDHSSTTETGSISHLQCICQSGYSTITTDTGVACKKEPLNTAVYVGIGIGVALLIIVIAVVVQLVLHYKFKKQWIAKGASTWKANMLSSRSQTPQQLSSNQFLSPLVTNDDL
ncbi:BMP family ABC transporter substrate-binding protein [Pelomyxa schiedti]|nr:BMP family ABC transporter substrate-binding protein [Pelomyxa schiedti]